MTQERPGMRRSKFSLAILMTGGGLLALSGCASVESAKPADSLATTATSGAPAPVAGYDWFYHADADQASLAYGLKDSDDLRLGLECSRGAGRLELSALAASGVREIHLESGGDTERFPAQGEPSQLHDGDFLTADSKIDAPVFQRFRRIGWLAQWQGDHREAYAAQAASVGNIERFFNFCS